MAGRTELGPALPAIQLVGSRPSFGSGLEAAVAAILLLADLWLVQANLHPFRLGWVTLSLLPIVFWLPMLVGAVWRLRHPLEQVQATPLGITCHPSSHPDGIVPWSEVRRIEMAGGARGLTSYLVLRLHRRHWNLWTWTDGPAVRFSLRDFGLGYREGLQLAKGLRAWRKAMASPNAPQNPRRKPKDASPEASGP